MTERQLPGLLAAPTRDKCMNKCMNMWGDTMAVDYPIIAKSAAALLSAHATSCASERNWSLWGNIYTKARSRLSLARAEKLVYIRGNSRAVYTADDDDKLLELLAEGEDVVDLS